VPARADAPRAAVSVHGPGPLPQPLVALLPHLEPTALRGIVLGLESMPPALTRPILHRLQKHPDVRVQLYANGLLNDQLDHLERRLATLKERISQRRSDDFTRTAIIEIYTHLFRSNLVAADEIAPTVAEALKECDLVLALDPANPTVMRARVEFQLLRGDFRDAAIGIEQLRPLPGQQNAAIALHARLLFDLAAAEPVSHPSNPTPSSEQRTRAIGN
jgi:hypothetical protein